MKLKKKVLIVTAKWPYTTKSTDGGDSTTKEIIRSLKDDYIVDMLCFRNDIDEQIKIDDVQNIFFYHDDFALFKNYQLHNEEKFLVRITQSEIAKKEIKRVYRNYNIIIVQHAMFLLDMEDEKELLDKIVLYPMFTGSSYIKSGEMVPKIYLDKEKKVLSLVKLIISPSDVEKNILIEDYGVDGNRIIVVPRPVDYSFSVRKISDSSKIRLLYIASVRTQKNHLDAMRLVKIIKERGVDVELHCIGAIQDDAIFGDCVNYLEINRLAEYVIFHGNKSHIQIEKIMSICDFNISVSQWETFGRGVYEGMVFGLPTLITDKLECIIQASNIGIFPCVVSSLEEMANTIIDLIYDDKKYEKESKKGKKLSSLLSVTNSDSIIRKKYKEVFGAWDTIKL